MLTPQEIINKLEIDHKTSTQAVIDTLNAASEQIKTLRAEVERLKPFEEEYAKLNKRISEIEAFEAETRG